MIIRKGPLYLYLYLYLYLLSSPDGLKHPNVVLLLGGWRLGGTVDDINPA